MHQVQMERKYYKYLFPEIHKINPKNVKTVMLICVKSCCNMCILNYQLIFIL